VSDPTRPDREVRAWVLAELRNASRAEDRWSALERAHIVSQPYAVLHTRVHLVMLRHALRERDMREAVGQVVRVVVAGPGSAVGRYPRGNSGRVSMGLTETADVSDELAPLVR
jgi:hypothetical protein